jgi:imidazoleglycerol-phosphate dehydratase/histidinol-phosphatase
MNGETPLLFVDRDGTLVEEPADLQVDGYDKLRFVTGMLPALLRLREAGYAFVMVSNQDGMGTDAFPEEAFAGPQRLLMQLLESQGIVFREVLVDRSLPADGAPTRKPALGLVRHLRRAPGIDWARSAVVGDRPSDVAFAANLGVRAFQLRTARFGGEWDWAGIAHALADRPRIARLARRTTETDITATLDLDDPAPSRIATGLGFLDHMLDQLARHGGFRLDLRCAGDLGVDEHHTVEDCALVLGAALREALGDKAGIGRYGFTLPMDEALASAVLDLSGRPCLVFEGRFTRERVGDLPTELVAHFFRSLCDAARMTLHLTVRGDNDHHRIEACFKAVGRALRQAVRRDGRLLPSTKGML